MQKDLASCRVSFSDVTVLRGREAAWRGWPPQFLWLSPDPALPAVRARMRAVLADALGTVPIAAVERIADFAEADEPGAVMARRSGLESAVAAKDD